jgi:hydroxyacyl-ACP dehydratase HTD2-like protein with hotdog domain
MAVLLLVLLNLLHQLNFIQPHALFHKFHYRSLHYLYLTVLCDPEELGLIQPDWQRLVIQVLLLSCFHELQEGRGTEGLQHALHWLLLDDPSSNK